jgi:hypothetical protein
MFSDEKGWPEVGDVVQYHAGSDFSRVLILECLGKEEMCMAYRAWYFDGFFGTGTRVKRFYVWPDDSAWMLAAKGT